MTPSFYKANSRELIRSNVPKLIFIGLIYIIITSILGELQFRLPAPVGIYGQLRTGLITVEQFTGSIRPYGLFLSLILGISLPVISIGYQCYCLKIVRNQKGEYTDLMTGFSIFTKVIGISIITTIIIFLWSLLLFFPGLIAYYKFRQAYFILLDDPSKGIMQCINESKQLMHGKKVDLFLLDISFIGWYLLDVLVLTFVIPVFSIVSIWLTPYYGLTQAAYYNNLIKEVTV
jgi:uncharacterized membrane protein